MPYPNEHAARIVNPEKFQTDSFRRKNIAPGIDIIIGKLKNDNTMTIQAYRFDSEKFSVEEAKKWLKEHNIKYTSFEPTKKAVEFGMKTSMKIQMAATEDYGYKWKVRVVDFGMDKNGTYWTKEPLINAISKFEGAKVFMLSEAQHQKDNHPYGKPTTEIVGWLSNVTYDDTGIDAELNILKSAKPLHDAIIDSMERGNPNLFGLSLDLHGLARKEIIDGKEVLYLEEVKSVTVDIVYEPAAGGRFLRMAAAKAGQKKEEAMWKKLMASLKVQRPDLRERIETIEAKGEEITEDDVMEILASAMAMKGLDERIKAAVESAIKDIKAVENKKDILDEARIIACSILLKDELKESGLPEISRARIQKQFEGKIFEEETLRAAIKEEKEYIDKLTGSGSIDGYGNVKITESEIEARAKIMDDFFDRKIHSFKAAYIKLTGDEKITGRIEAATRLKASLTTASFDQILGESITRRMLKEYADLGLNDWKKIVDIVPISDFRTQRRLRFGGYGNLPTVNEGASYTALTSPSDEEATYSAAKRGGTEDITIETIKNDDVGAIRRIPTRLANAAARTLYEFTFAFLADNPNIYDGTALFTVGHSNMGTDALSGTSLAAGRNAMLKQTDMSSGKGLGIAPRYLVVPVDLDKTAYDLITPPDTGQYTPTTPDYIKKWRLEMIVVPFWTDTNNWYLVADPAQIPIIEIGFMDGNETPELFVQDLPNVGSMFNNDKLTYKIRHIYGGAVMDYRGFYGAIVI